MSVLDGALKNNEPQKVSALNSTVIRLGLVSFFADISSEMLYPITPIFLTTVLGASMTSVGLIEGVAEAIASLLKTYSGVWSDRIKKRKAFICVGYLLAAVSKPLTGIATKWSTVLLARSLDRTGKGLRTAPRDALLSDSVPESQQGAAFGWHRFMDTLGAAIGPLIAILYLSIHSSDLRSIYYWALLPGLVAVAITFSVREVQTKLDSKTATIPPLKLKELPQSFKTYLLAWGIFSITNSSDVFLLMQAKSKGVGLTVVILLYCFYNLTYALASPSLGHLSDRIGRKKCLITGLLVFALVYFGFASATMNWHFWILFGIYGLYMAATDGVGKALAIDLNSKDSKATAIGMLGTVTGLATVVASTFAGFLWDHVSPKSAFLFGVIGSGLASLILLKVKENKRTT